MKKLNLFTIYSIIGLLSFACNKSDDITPEEDSSQTETEDTTDTIQEPTQTIIQMEKQKKNLYKRD